ncbi:MAG: hypothetical protein OEV80_11980, partial [candidate division Zixibacteria bacterium]|nr:hypothetical protein [candidate division Zixibacteria bacterium]
MTAKKSTLELRKPPTEDKHGAERQIALQIQAKIDRVILPMLDQLAGSTEPHRAELIARIRAGLKEI